MSYLNKLSSMDMFTYDDIADLLLDDLSEEERTKVHQLLGATSYFETFINERYLEEHARETVEEVYEVKPDVWPFNCVDWSKASKELHKNYQTFELNGLKFFAKEG